MIVTTIQRMAAKQTVEHCSLVVKIESNAIKGKIIDKEGRNIRAPEAATGVDIIVDDTPETVLLSSFDLIKKEIARLALQQLIQDSRAHPARIEEVVAKTKKHIEKEIIDTGELTTSDLGIYGMHEELIKLVGTMRYRTFYGQICCATLARWHSLQPPWLQSSG